MSGFGGSWDWERGLLTIVGHVSVSFLEHQVDPASSSPDLLHSLAVGHPGCAFSVDLHQLVRHLKEETFEGMNAARATEASSRSLQPSPRALEGPAHSHSRFLHTF